MHARVRFKHDAITVAEAASDADISSVITNPIDNSRNACFYVRIRLIVIKSLDACF